MNESSSLRRLTPVVASILLLNYSVFMYLSWFSEESFESLIQYWSLIPAREMESIENFDFVGPISAIFRSMSTHFSLSHLLGNMIPILAVGIVIVRTSGSKIFLFCFFFGGFLAALGVIAFNPDNQAYIVGASGGAAALYGFFLLNEIMNDKDKLFIRVISVLGFLTVFAAVVLYLFSLSPIILPGILDKVIVIAFFSGVVAARRMLWVIAITLWIAGNCYSLLMENYGLYVTGSATLLHLCGILAGIVIAGLNGGARRFFDKFPKANASNPT